MTFKLVIFYIIAEAIVGSIVSDIFQEIGRSFTSKGEMLINCISLVITLLISWHISISTAFKKNTIDVNEIKNLMRNLIIFVAILCIVVTGIEVAQVFYAFNESIQSIEEEIESMYDEIKRMEYSSKYSHEEKVEKKELYEIRREIFEDRKSDLSQEVFSKLGINKILSIPIYFIIVIYEKKNILKKMYEF